MAEEMPHRLWPLPPLVSLAHHSQAHAPSWVPRFCLGTVCYLLFSLSLVPCQLPNPLVSPGLLPFLFTSHVTENLSSP